MFSYISIIVYIKLPSCVHDTWYTCICVKFYIYSLKYEYSSVVEKWLKEGEMLRNFINYITYFLTISYVQTMDDISWNVAITQKVFHWKINPPISRWKWTFLWYYCRTFHRSFHLISSMFHLIHHTNILK